MAELRGSDQDCVACKDWSIYYLTLHIKSLPIPASGNTKTTTKIKKRDKLEKSTSNTEAEQYQEMLSPRSQEWYGLTQGVWKDRYSNILVSKSNVSETHDSDRSKKRQFSGHASENEITEDTLKL